MENAALLIIDVQGVMFFSENMSLHHEDLVLANIKQILETARKVNIPVIFIQHTDDEKLIKGSPAWEIHPAISPVYNEIVIEKCTRDASYETSRQAKLQKLGIKTLIIVGMQTEFCVDTTCRSASSKGYNCILVQDAHSTFDCEFLTGAQIIQHHNRILDTKVVQLKTTAEMINLIQQ